jgi:phage gpG-like protein
MEKKTGFSLRFERSGFDKKVRRSLEAATNARPLWASVLGMMRDSVEEEFMGGYYKTPSGGIEPWKPHVPFGNAPRGSLLNNQGRLMRAWTTGGVAEKTWAGLGPRGGDMDGTPLLKIAAVHRGGLSPRPRAEQVTVVKAINAAAGSSDKLSSRNPLFWAQYWFLRKNFEVYATYNKMRVSGFKIPARPHATMHPALASQIKEAARDWLIRNSVRGGRRGRAAAR